MEADKKRKVRAMYYKEVLLEDLDEGHVFQLLPNDPESEPNIDPSKLYRVSMSTKSLSREHQSDRIEAEVVVIGTRHHDKIRIENIQNLMNGKKE